MPVFIAPPSFLWTNVTAAEERRNSPPCKVVTVLYTKENHSYSTTAMKPKLLPDGDQNDILSRYAVVFLGNAETFQVQPDSWLCLILVVYDTYKETVVLRVSDMQLSDEGPYDVMVNFCRASFCNTGSCPILLFIFACSRDTI
jgi:hypothetical protein